MVTKIAKAKEIVQRFEGRLDSRKIKDKIMSQCRMSTEGASTYYYRCRDELTPKKRRA